MVLLTTALPPKNEVSPAGNRTRDLAMLRAFSSGSDAGFAQFYKRFAGVLFATIFRILRDHHATAETMQQAFVEMSRQSSEFPAARATLFAWVVTIARKEALKRRRRTDGREADTVSSGFGKTESADTSDPENGSRVPAAFAFLTRAEQNALELCLFEGLSASAASSKLHIRVGEFHSRVRRGLFGLMHALSLSTLERGGGPSVRSSLSVS